MEPTPAERIPLPWSRGCFVCGEDNADGLRLRSFKVGDRIELPVTLGQRFAGWNEVTHGGLIATVLDEVMTWASILGSERACYAAEVTVRMLAPLPPGTACRAVGHLAGRRRRIFDAESWLEDDDGIVYARATGRYMPVPAHQMGSLRQDFVHGDGCLDLSHIAGF